MGGGTIFFESLDGENEYFEGLCVVKWVWWVLSGL